MTLNSISLYWVFLHTVYKNAELSQKGLATHVLLKMLVSYSRSCKIHRCLRR